MTGVRLAALLLLAAAPLTAQQGRMLTDQDFQNVKPESCPAADSLAGHPLTKPKQAAQGMREGIHHEVISSFPFDFTAHRPVDGIMLNAVYDGEGPNPRADYTMQLHLQDSVLRQGAATFFTLVLDSTEVRVGGMEASVTPYSHGHVVDQMLTTPVPTDLVRRLVAARSVQGRIGTWEFPVPDKTLETFHAVFIAASCGTHLR